MRIVESLIKEKNYVLIFYRHEYEKKVSVRLWIHREQNRLNGF